MQQLIQTQLETIYLTDSESNTLRQAAEALHYPSAGPVSDFVREAQSMFADAAPKRLIRSIQSLRSSPTPPPAIVVENMPFEANVDCGPVDPNQATGCKRTSLSEAYLLGAAALAGDPFGWAHEGCRLVNNLVPHRDHAQAYTGLGSEIELSLHIESAVLRTAIKDRAPAGLALIGVSSERDGGPATLIADARLALNQLDPKTVARLRQPDFLVRAPVRWRSVMGHDEWMRTPIVLGPSDAPSIVLVAYGNATRGDTKESQAVLESFSEALASVAVSLVIRPGRLVLIDNHIAVHGRTAFKAGYDDCGRPLRWLQRVLWAKALRDLGDWSRPQDRVFAPLNHLTLG
jgi:L-asparagine oxygenase